MVSIKTTRGEKLAGTNRRDERGGKDMEEKERRAPRDNEHQQRLASFTAGIVNRKKMQEEAKIRDRRRGWTKFLLHNTARASCMTSPCNQ